MRLLPFVLMFFTFSSTAFAEESFSSPMEEVQWIDRSLKTLHKQWLRERRQSNYHEKEGDRIYWQDSGLARHSYRRAEHFSDRMLDTRERMDALKSRRAELTREKKLDPVESL